MRSTLLQLFDTTVKVDNYNNDFLLLRAKEGNQLTAIGNAIYQRNFDFVEEVIVTEVEVCLQLNKRFQTDHLKLLQELERGAEVQPKSFRLPVLFTAHEDWKNIEQHTGFDKETIIEKLIQTELSLAMFGFLPGFLYLNGLPQSLQVPRKTVPAKYVEAGSLAIGGSYLGCYALDSPGGWQVIGKTPLQLLQLTDLPPLPIQPGDQVRIEKIDQEAYDRLVEQAQNLTDYNA